VIAGVSVPGRDGACASATWARSPKPRQHARSMPRRRCWAPMLDRAFLEKLRAIVGDDGMITARPALQTYACDGLTGRRGLPGRGRPGRSPPRRWQRSSGHALRHQVPFVARGAGTGLSGGALPVADGVVNRPQPDALDPRTSTSRTTRSRCSPGSPTSRSAKTVRPLGYSTHPIPHRNRCARSAGNVAENSGGAHCLKYGFNTHHVLGATFVTAEGRIARLGGAVRGRCGLRPARHGDRQRGDASAS